MQILHLLNSFEPDHRAHHTLVFLRILQLDAEGLLHLIDAERVLDVATSYSLELRIRLLLRLEVDSTGSDLGITSRVRRISSF